MSVWQQKPLWLAGGRLNLWVLGFFFFLNKDTLRKSKGNESQFCHLTQISKAGGSTRAWKVSITPLLSSPLDNETHCICSRCWGLSCKKSNYIWVVSASHPKMKERQRCCSKEKEMISYNYPQCPRKTLHSLVLSQRGEGKSQQKILSTSWYFWKLLRSFVIGISDMLIGVTNHLTPWGFHCFVHNFITFTFEDV